MRVWNGELLDGYDVVVAGSGAIGLTAALTAAAAGKSVCVLEKSQYLGGTSAISGGTLWIAANGPMLRGGGTDSREDALRYLKALTKGRHPEELLEAVVDTGPDMIEFVAEHGLKFNSVLNYPDYRQDLAGSSKGGRSLDPQLFDSTALGELRAAVRPDPRLPFTMEEYEAWGAFTRFPWDELKARKERGLTSRGLAVVSSLVAALARLGVTLVTEAPFASLLREGERVTGVRVGDLEVSARDGVVLATGGFEWNDDMLKQFIGAPFIARCSPPHNTGDGIRAGAAIGATLRNMHEAWWAPYAQLPHEKMDGAPNATLLRFERQGPGSIIVDRQGNRFVNESQNYNDLTRAMHAYEPRDHAPAHLPAWVIVDADYVRRYGLFDFRLDQPLPEWLVSGDSAAELAERLEMPADALRATLDRFNRFAATGEDLDYSRGASAYDRYWGDSTRGLPNPALAPLSEYPLFAFAAIPGGFGTCGGLATDADARVLDWNNQVIDGLYAVGNTSAHPASGGYPGAGATLGPGMTMAYRAGKSIASS
ncbi:FAD-dependent oxidoreductase [Ruicaihuangia caeni]|uniref:FAD-dependent oxidoreductase n=1 Tax=Ruicaihuangia caeni TaxID=3042517 RepID=UPI00339051F7